MQKQLRQGDVLLVRVAAVPSGATPVERDQGRVILAYGEVTGHCHAVRSDAEAVEMFLADLNGQTYLSVSAPATVVHEEHGVIPITDPGTFRVVRPLEYTPAAIVVDRD